jgi:hypothetical protein
MNTPIFNLGHNCKPVALYTYETAHAQNIILRMKDHTETYTQINNIVESYFGANHMDNKITIECEILLELPIHEQKQLIYLTYWDGILSIGLSARFDKDFIKPDNQYRKIWANHLKPS